MDWENISEEVLDTLNKHGWSLRDCAEDTEHPGLGLTLSNIPDGGSEEKEELIGEMTKWEFDPGKQLKILKELGIDGENAASMILETIQEFEDGEEETISEMVDVGEYDPADRDNILDDELAEKVEEVVNDDNRKAWSDQIDTDTEWLTPTRDLELPSGQKIEEGDTYEFPADIAEELKEIKVEGRRITGRWAWKCPDCGETKCTGERETKPYCPSPVHDEAKKMGYDTIKATVYRDATDEECRELSVRDNEMHG
ncbi:hypothetical protein AKJ37_04025, partial [candidate division MSBL1 archaeon SCGC-AAA259I09]